MLNKQKPTTTAATETSPENSAPSSRANKRELVLDLMRRPGGATLAEMTEATGWLPHSTRAVLTGLRKQGYAVVREKRGNETCYRVPGNA